MSHRAPLSAQYMLLLLALAAAGASGEVDNERPDLSMFKLRRVDTRQLARSRLAKPIADLASGALHMHESLFVEAQNVKCPAYAHLFKLIKSQPGEDADEDSKMVIRQNFVETLAVMVTYERILYHKLFLQPGQLQVSAGHFIEALELLEELKDFGGARGYEAMLAGTSGKQATWYDLYQCLGTYMSGRLVPLPGVQQLLGDPKRVRQAASLAQFRAIPVESSMSQPVDGELAPDGLVGGLTNRYEAGIMKRRMLSADELRKANEQIEALEDAATTALKRQLAEELASRPSGGSGGTKEEESQAMIPAEAKEEPPKSMEAVSHQKLPEEVELVVPVEALDGASAAGIDEAPEAPEAQGASEVPGPEVAALEESAGKSRPEPEALKEDSGRLGDGAQTVHFREAQLAILRFIRMRLEQTTAASSRAEAEAIGRVPKLSMELAFDFASHWADLRAAGKHLEASTTLGRHALEFLQDPANAALAKRVRRAIDTYVELTQVLDYMKLQEDQYESIYDLRLPLDKITRLLETMDASFDVDDLRRVHAIWLAKYTEYNTMDRFINSDSW